MQNEGYCSYRLKGDLNIREKIFAEEWEKENKDFKLLEQLMFNATKKYGVTEKDIKLVAMIMQWLGSNCGQVYLMNCLKKIPENRRFFNHKDIT